MTIKQIGAVLLAAAVLGCGGRRRADDIGPATTPAGRPIGEFLLTTILSPAVPRFTAEARVSGGIRENEIEVAIAIAGSDPGRQHPWHVHRGTCQNQEIAPIGPAAAYRNLDVRADGTADRTQKIAVEMNPLQPHYVDVHLSNMRMDYILACGNLVRR